MGTCGGFGMPCLSQMVRYMGLVVPIQRSVANGNSVERGGPRGEKTRGRGEAEAARGPQACRRGEKGRETTARGRAGGGKATNFKGRHNAPPDHGVGPSARPRARSVGTTAPHARVETLLAQENQRIGLCVTRASSGFMIVTAKICSHGHVRVESPTCTC